jgi:rhamnulokinase
MSQFIALDLGAESGRAIVGKLESDRLSLEEAYRFPNGAVRVMGSLHWDPLYLFKDMKQGLSKISHEHGRGFTSIGIDTWGIDYALLDRAGNLIGNPYCYRDPRTEGMMDEATKHVPRQEIFDQSGGIQFLPINTLYQLFSMVVNKSPLLEIAETFLMMPDLFNYWFTGCKACEFTDATTTQFYNSQRGDWSRGLLEQLDIPSHMLPDVIMPGTELGPLLPGIAEEVTLGSLLVIAPASHDTASAVVAVPAEGEDCAWLSSGTWSLLGGMSYQPIVTDEALEYNFSSYGGAGGTYLPWKNIMGLWLVQECRRTWARAGKDFSYDESTRMAGEAKPFSAIVDPDHPSFLAPSDMPGSICTFCEETGQPVPQTKGEIVRTALEGLALKYRWVIEKLEVLLDRKFKVLHVVGGGSKNRLLCQFTADAIQLPVIAGPVEATAIGNIVVQAMTAGHLASLDEARHLIRRSFDVTTYEPGDSSGWDEAYERFGRLIARNGGLVEVRSS